MTEYPTSRELARRKYRASEKGREAARIYSRKYYHEVLKYNVAEKAKRKTANANNHYRKYGLTLEEAKGLKLAGCSLCGVKIGKMNVDHDHRTGKFRGILCNPCNLTIGWLERCEMRLSSINEYLGRSYGSVG